MVAAGTTDFRKRYPEKKLDELCMMAFRMLLEENDLKMDPLEVKGLINFACYGEFADHFQDQLLCEAKVHDYLGLDPLPNVGVKTGGATGGSTMLVGATTVASGLSRLHARARLGAHGRGQDLDRQLLHRHRRLQGLRDAAGAQLRQLLRPDGPALPGDVQRGRAGARRDRRQEPRLRLLTRRSRSSPGGTRSTRCCRATIVSDPLRFLECCAMSVGSAAALLCSEELAYKLTDNPVRLYIAGGSHTLRTGDRRPMRIPLLPHETEEGYTWLYDEMEKQDGRWPGFESFGATRFAAYMAYRMAGIKDPIEDLDLVETHDAFTISDLQTYGDVGLTLYGREQDYVTSGECYLHNPRTGKPGKCPANLSGGLLGTMHAVGATGIFQCGEVFWQLQGKYDKFHGDPEALGALRQEEARRLEEPAGEEPAARPGDLARRRRQPRDVRGPREGLVGGAR